MAHSGCVWRTGDVVELLQRLELEPLSEMEQQILLSRAAMYAEVKSTNLAAPACPCCGGEQVSPMDATPLEARAALQDLINACGVYAGDMGFAGDGLYYSKVWSE